MKRIIPALILVSLSITLFTSPALSAPLLAVDDAYTVTPTATDTPTATATPTSTATFTPTHTPSSCALQATITSSTWTNTAGVNNDVCTDNDVRMVWREPTSAGSTVNVDFTTNVSTMYTLRFNGYYSGGHAVSLECNNGASWTWLADLTASQSNDETINIAIPQSCNDGTPIIRFYHGAAGNASHYIRIDQMILEIVPPTVTPTFTATNTATATATSTSTATNTATPSGPTNTPAVVPTWYISPTVSYGEFMIDAVLLGLCGAVIIIAVTMFIIIVSQKGKR